MKLLRLYFFIALVSASLQADTIFLEGYGDKQPIRKTTAGNIDYFSASDFFHVIGGTCKWLAPENRLEVYLASHRLSFQLANPFFLRDSELRHLIYPPIYYVDDIYLPVDESLRLLEDILGQVLVYDRRQRALVATSSGNSIVRVTVEQKLNGILLEIVLTERLEYDVFVTEGNWINVTIIGGTVDVDQIARRRSLPQVRRIRAFQFENSAQVSIKMRGKVREYHHNYAAAPHRIQISIEDLEFEPEELEGFADVQPKEYDAIDIIVIDAGHGGRYDGAVGKGGLREKDVVLDISLRLEELLDRDLRFTPVLTRRKDMTVELEQRALIANDARGDLFVSIHVNSSKKRKANGCETFFLAAATNDEARVTELLENSDFQLELPEASSGNKDLDFIVMDLLQTEYVHQSRQLAEIIQGCLQARLNIKSRGINQAGFAVLNRVNMPSVLVECAFISNKVEEKLLGQADFRQAITESIYQGIVHFAELYDREKEINAISR